MKSLFKRKNKFPTESAPRSTEEINKAYSEALAQAGQAQYLIYVYTRDLAQTNERLLALNQEAAKRQAFDRAENSKPAANTEDADNKSAPASNGAAQEVQSEQA